MLLTMLMKMRRPQRLAVLTMIKIQQELASKRRSRRSSVQRELASE